MKTKREWKEYGKRLKQARVKRELSLRALGEKTKVCYQVLHRLESGLRIREENLEKVDRWLRRAA